MSSLDLEEPWGQLIALSDESGERIPIVGSKFNIGRNKDADCVIETNKCVSGLHCSLVRDKDGGMWLQDTSTNGTLVNGTKVHQSKAEITDGAVIKIVFRKDQPKLNVSYRFHDLRTDSVNDSLYTEATLEMTVEYDEDNNNYSLKRKCTEDDKEEPGSKKPALDPAETIVVTASAEASNDNDRKGTSEEQPLTRRDSSPHKPDLDKKDSIEETLICQICQEILHDCVSLQPCMHSYCGGCYSDWMKYSRECPACRNNVERVSKNHIVNNLVDAYLRSHPEKKRPDEDLKELDEKNKITKEMLYPKKSKSKSSTMYGGDGDESDEYSSSSTLSDSISSDGGGGGSYSASKPFGSMFSTGPLFSSSFLPPLPAPIPISCRQCPGHIPVPVGTAPSFVCSPSTNHIMCNCCLQPMPDRRTDPDLSIPPQKCDVCSRAFCHMYWGCGKFGCRGCLNLFKDVDFDSAVLSYIINDNSYESEILKNYIESKGLTIKDLLQQCLAKLDAGTYTSSDTRTSRISSSSRTCYQCALKNFKDLAYQFRKGLSNEDLPSEVVARTNCYYGNNCRTQKHNRDHCKKYNHICEQIKY